MAPGTASHAPALRGHFIVLDTREGEGTTLGQNRPPTRLVRLPQVPRSFWRRLAADEAAHIALKKDREFEPLPHPLAGTSVSDAALDALPAMRRAQGFNDPFPDLRDSVVARNLAGFAPTFGRDTATSFAGPPRLSRAALTVWAGYRNV